MRRVRPGRWKRDRSEAPGPVATLPYVRVLLRDGRTLEGYSRDAEAPERSGLLTLTGITKAFGSDMKEIVSTPMDAAIPRNMIVRVEYIESPLQDDAAPDTARRPPRPALEPSELTGLRTELEADLLRRGRLILAALISLGIVLAGLLVYSVMADGRVGNAGTSASPSSTSPGVSPAPVAAPASIAFLSDRSGNLEIYVKDAFSDAAARLTDTGGQNQGPDWSPNRLRLAFSSDLTGNVDVFVVKADGTQLANVTTSAADEFDPDWSPDGDQLALSTDFDGDFDIHVMDATGGDAPTVITDNTADDASPDYSPDGSLIAFASNLDGDFDIYVAAADASGDPRPITSNSDDDRAPQWSPDGSSILFDSDAGGDSEIYVLDLDQETVSQLTNNAVDDRHAAWFPQGDGIVFERDVGGDSELFAFDLGSETPAHPLTDNDSDDVDPALR